MRFAHAILRWKVSGHEAQAPMPPDPITLCGPNARATLPIVGTVDSVRANLALANAWGARGRFREARALRLASLELARRLDDPETLFRSALPQPWATAPNDWDEFARIADEVTAWPRDGVSSQTLGQVLWLCGRIQLAQGERVRAEETWRQLHELAERTHVVSVHLQLVQLEAALAIVDGQLEHALVLIERFAERAEDAGATARGRMFGLALRRAPALYLGHAHAWLAAFDEYAQIHGPHLQLLHWTCARAVCLAQIGRMDEARTVAGPLLADVLRNTDDADELPIHTLASLLEAAVVIGDRAATQSLVARLAAFPTCQLRP